MNLEGMKTPKVEYDVFCKLFGTNLIKLNLTACSTSKITISIPFVITENIDKYNKSSGYYNDICYTTTSEYGTDITLKDRRANFINGDKIVCQEGCEFTEYDSEISKAQCSCNVEKSPSSIDDMKIDKRKLLENFINIKNFANFNFLLCYKKLFCKKGILNNIGSYVIFAIIFFHIITLIIFYINQFPSLKKKIINIPRIIIGKKNKRNIETLNEQTIKMLFSKKNVNKRRKKLKRKQNSERLSNIKLMKYNDDELNALSYDLAINHDKRTYCEFYGSLLKTQHSFISSFINNSDYNSKIIKIDLFFIGFAIEYAVNALFYDDDTMHKIYKSKGAFDLKTQTPIMLYSALISMILNAPLNFFGLSNDDIISFKQDKSKITFQRRAKYLMKKLSIKFILFFIIGFLLLVFLWYYTSMFCVIYKNTQIHLTYDTLSSFGLSLLFPFVIYLLPGIFRIPALSDTKHESKLLYDFSKVFQLL